MRCNVLRQTGAAIIAAMLVTATVATLATGMLSQINGWFVRAESARDGAQAQSLANVAVRWASQYLLEESRLGPTDHLGELWATGLPATPIEGGTLGGAIADAQARFNFNNVIAGKGEMSEPDLAFAQTLFEAANVPSAQISTLLAKRRAGFLTECDLPESVRKTMTALPERTGINVNTAPETLLKIIAPGATTEAWQARAVTPFTGSAQFFSKAAATAKSGALESAPKVEIGVSTRYFLIDVAATFGQAQAGTRALIERTKGVVWQVAL